MSLLDMILTKVDEGPLKGDYVLEEPQGPQDPTYIPEPDCTILIEWVTDRDDDSFIITRTLGVVSAVDGNRSFKEVTSPLCSMGELISTDLIGGIIADATIAYPDKIVCRGTSREGRHFNLVVKAKTLGPKQWHIVSWE